MSGSAPTAHEEHADAAVLAALLREVDRDSAVRGVSATNEPQDLVEDGTHTVRGRTVADARAKAQDQYGPVDVLDGYQTYSLLGRKQVVLTVRPQTQTSALAVSASPPARFAHEDVLWNRATLRGLGVPRSLLGRLPLDDPGTQEEWEEVLTSLIAYEMSAPSPYAENGTVNGVGARGAAAILAGMEAGIPPGTLELQGVPFPATAPILVLALRSSMPLRVPPPVDHPVTIPPLPPAPERTPEHAALAFHVPEDHETSGSPGDAHDDDEATPSDNSIDEGDSHALTTRTGPEAAGEIEEGAHTSDDAPNTYETPEEAATDPEEGDADVVRAAGGVGSEGTQDESAAAPPSAPPAPRPAVPPRVSGEVNGKLPRSVARRSVPGGHKTPYPTDGVDL